MAVKVILLLLANLVVAHITFAAEHYSRDQWPHWSDSDGNCLNTRHEVLLARSTVPAAMGKSGCFVSSGRWVDPYTEQVFEKAKEVDIDHVVALAWAHANGGGSWSEAEKEFFANDPDNLIVTGKAINQIKGALGPSQWLPPNLAFVCEYLRVWRHILAKYPDLRMRAYERAVYEKKLAACASRSQE